MRRLHSALFVGSSVLALIAACGTDGGSQFPNGGDTDGGGGGSSGSSGDQPFFPPSEAGREPDAQVAPIEIAPADQVVTYVSGEPAPTLQFTAKIIATGEIVPASFTIDRGEIGSVGLTSGLFTATGAVGGKARITGVWNGTSANTSVTVKMKVVENGGGSIADAGADGGGGAGGNGGVGGDGPGGSVDTTMINVLKGTPATDPGLSLLYPYNETVWPRGILAPLLMWKPGAQADYDAVLIKIQETNYEYEGTFAKNALTFQNHPIPQQVWKQLLASNQGEEVKVSLVFAKGGAAYGPLNVTWKIASAPLKGIVYYNSYGTRLANNYEGAKPDDSTFGGATLGIRGGSTDPVLVAGGDGGHDQCRVCHSVAANGSALITQRNTGDKRLFSTYDLKTNVETPMSPEGGDASGTNKYSWPAIYPDGTMFLGDSSGAEGSHNTPNQLYSVVSSTSGGGADAGADAGTDGGADGGTTAKTPAALAMNGWPTDFRAAFPAFSPDGKNLAFTMYAGVTGADQKTIGTMTFDKSTNTFGPLREIFRPANSAHTAVYPAFLPTNDAVVFHVETRYNTRDYGGTRSDKDTSAAPEADRGARAELWWATVPAGGGAPVAARLDKLNGLGYLPTGANAHDDDATLNYEPTVNPVPSGGYAWVVFTSRRLYGNVATMNPFHSDPRYFDLTKDATTKKLWVAAIDLNAPPGTDPSHPAFYLPAQELLAGNARGYWVVDPCKSDASSCESGDECCGGFCRPDQGGKLVCSTVVPACAQEFEKCTTSADCCNAASYQCINGRCAAPAPPGPK